MASPIKYTQPKRGDQYGNWEILTEPTIVRVTAKSGRKRWQKFCRCQDVSTGETKDVDVQSLIHGTSTGSTTAGLRDRDIYGYAEIIPDRSLREKWLNWISAVMSRCYTKSSSVYEYYGLRGIKVHEKLHDRAEFLRHITTLKNWDASWAEFDRLDNDGDYAPGNIRMSTRSENNSNKENNCYIVHADEKMSAYQFWRRYAPRYRSGSTVARKINEGATGDQIIADQERCKGPYKRRNV